MHAEGRASLSVVICDVYMGAEFRGSIPRSDLDQYPGAIHVQAPFFTGIVNPII